MDNQSLLAGIIGLVLIVLGAISIFAKDLAWEMTEWSNRNRGVQSERTPEWETSSTIGGVIAIVAGVFCLFAAVAIF
jgi:hypothetical protein